MSKELRNESTMMQLIKSFAEAQKDIQAVILNGSRVSPSAKQDRFQDYDVICVVDNVEPYVSHQKWIEHFGELLIMQTPDLIDGNWPQVSNKFTFLMLFTDGNRIDLSFMTKQRYTSTTPDSQSLVVLDKKQAFSDFPPPSDQDYLPQAPSEKQFNDCCNEFWWVSTYVAKGLARNQVLYAKHMSEQCVKEMLLKLLGWYAALRSKYQKPLGHCNKYLQEQLPAEIWQALLATYTDGQIENMWSALFKMCALFNQIAAIVAKDNGFQYTQSDYQPVLDYVKQLKEL